MSDPYILKHKEAVLLRCIMGGRKYGRQLRTEYGKRMGKPISIGGLYDTLTELEDRGYIKSEIELPNWSKASTLKTCSSAGDDVKDSGSILIS